MNAKITQPGDEVRLRILEAATQRFAQFGYNKTTMAEVAQDCGMSAANLYRYFENKLDIGANLACSCLSTKREQMQIIIRQRERGAAERLQDVVLQALNYTYEQWSENPRMNEMVNAICGARMNIVDEHKQGEHQLLMELLEDGNARGEFQINNIDDTATAIATAITAFNIPLLMPLCSIETFRQRAKSVVWLLLNGLLNKQPTTETSIAKIGKKEAET
jgi:AcrR family transcriptional regulator